MFHFKTMNLWITSKTLNTWNYTMGLQKKLTINRQKGTNLPEIYFKWKTIKVSWNTVAKICLAKLFLLLLVENVCPHSTPVMTHEPSTSSLSFKRTMPPTWAVFLINGKKNQSKIYSSTPKNLAIGKNFIYMM